MRPFLGPLLLAASTWCAAGAITVMDPDAASVRLATAAPLWIAAAALALALAVPGWRRHPLTAAPALLSTIPWWPVPLPAIALLWTGPLAWAPVLAALLAALLSSRAERPLQGAPFAPQRAALLAGALGAAACLLTAWALAPRLPGGDEPHYLVIAQSLLADGDLDIRNNHAARDYASYYPGELKPDFLRAGRRGEIYSIHAPGLPALVLPGFALSGYRGAQATVLLLGALTGAAVWWLAWMTTRSGSAAWFAWAAIVLTPTFLIQGVTIFPDGPAALVAAGAVWLLIRLRDAERRPGPAALAFVGALLAVLPWLHTRLAVLAGAFGLAIAGAIALDRESPRRARRLLAFLALPLAGAAAWLLFFYALYGTADPTAPYGGPSADRSWTFVPGGAAGLLFDQQFGVVSYAPVLLIAAAGIGVSVRSRWGPTVAASLTAGACYLAATATYWMWWGGVPAPPARFAMAALPLLAMPLGLAWDRFSRPARTVAIAALVWSGAIAVCVIGIGRGALAWNVRDGQAAWLDWLSPVVNLPRGWPSFFWSLTPGDVSTEWPFAVHVTIWLSTIALASLLAVRLARRLESRGVPVGVSATITLLVTLMVAVQTGWWVNGSSGLDASRSQLALLGSVSRGAATVLIGPLGVRSGGGAVAGMAVRPEEPPRFRPELPWAIYSDVPPGDYELSFTATRPKAGELTIRIGRAREPLAVHPLQPLSGQTVPLSLPEGASALVLDVDAGLKEAGARVALRRKE